MRELKFRVFNEVTKEMIYPDDDRNFVIDNHGLLFFITDDLQLASPMGCYYHIYTGLKDKNGKEIYEGDVIKWHDQNNDDLTDNIYFIVSYDDGGFLPFADSDDNMPYPKSYECEIMGNIYENPEMIG